jgi:NodT family efflux transporter outer membrane factor (OMF) lipoprotein
MMGHAPLLALLATAPLLAGCGLARWLTPDAPGSGMVMPERLRLADPAVEARWPDAEWWRGFNAPELDRLLQAALLANQDIAVAEAQLRQADAQLRITGAALLPEVGLTTQAIRQQTTVSTASAGLTGTLVPRKPTRKFSSNDLAFSGSYEIDFWGKNRAAVESAQQSRAAGRFNVGAVTITIAASVANTYFALLAAQEQLEILGSNLATAEGVLAIIRARLAAGTATGLDVAQQETLVAQLRTQAPPLIRAAEQNRNALATLVGRPPAAIRIGGVQEGHGLSHVTVPPAAPGLTADLLVRRPDVWLAEANLAAANANVIVARAQLLPSVTLTGVGGWQSLAAETLIQPSSFIFTLVAGLAQPIFQGGALIGQIRLNEARARELLASYRQAILAALQDTEDAVVGLRETTERERLQAMAVDSAERANAIAEAQLRAGTIDLVTLLLTQQSLFNARNTLTVARLERLQAAVGLFRALGGGWDTTA